MFRKIILIIIALCCALSIYSSDPDLQSAILVSDVPVTYGDESFRERILERTKGERDPIGLVLTGGSARAFAHLGVLEYLEKEGIVPDFIVSNSMGSIIAMLYAAGVSPEDIMDLLESVELSDLFTFTLPIRGGLLIPDGFEALVESVIGADTRLENLDIPVMVVCDDLVTKREIRITEGDFTDVLIASFALPVYFEPALYNGHLLIDGGVVSLLPLEAAYEYSDTIIVSTTFYSVPSLNLLNPITILNGAFDIGKNQNAAKDIRNHPFIWIRCDVEDFSFMEFGKSREMAEIGYESAAAVSSELADIYRSELPEGFASKRRVYGLRIDEAAKDLTYFHHISPPTPSMSLGFVFDSDHGTEFRRYLSDKADLAIELRYRTRTLDMGIRTGGSFDFSSNGTTGAYGLLGADIAYYPLNSLRFTLESSVTIGYEPWYIPSIYTRQGFDWIILSDTYYSLAFKEALEHTTDFKSEDATLLTAFVDGEYSVWFFDFYASFGYMLMLDDGSDTKFRNYMDVDFAFRFSMPFYEPLFLDTSLFSRFSVDGRGNVPLFIDDGYSSKILGVGADFYKLSQRHNTILSFAVGYDVPVNPAFSEFVIFEDLEAAVFCDILFHDNLVDVSTGVEFQTAFSLIGLLNVPFRMRLGYDTLSSSFAGTFLLSLKY